MPHLDPDTTATIKSIPIAPGQLAVTLDLRGSTSLRSCTHLDADPDTGQPVLVRNFPRLSSGEELLWSITAWLSGQRDLPPLADLEAGLDAAHWATVRNLLWSEGIPC